MTSLQSLWVFLMLGLPLAKDTLEGWDVEMPLPLLCSLPDVHMLIFSLFISLPTLTSFDR